MSIISFVAVAIITAFQWLYNKILSFVHNGQSQTIPTIRNYVLMESASSLAKKIRNKKLTSTQVVESFIQRIQEVHEILNCVVDNRFEEALNEAKKADELIESGTKSVEELEKEFPFLGVPFSISGSISAKGLIKTDGVFKETLDTDPKVVSAMRKAGAIPIASTNVSEGCYTIETNNHIFGRTLNPYNSNRTTGGSSGGLGCLISSSASSLGIACDFKTSLRLSGAFTGVFTHTPSTKTVSLTGIHPLPLTVGPMSKSSEDLLPAMQILTNNSKNLNLSEPVDIKKLKYYFIDCEESILGSKIDEEVKEVMQQAMSHFQSTHRAKVEKINMERMKKAFFIYMGRRGKDLRKAIAQEEKTSCMGNVVKAIFGHSRHTLSYAMMQMMEERMEGLVNAAEKELAEDFIEISKELKVLLNQDSVLLYPTQPTGAFLHNESATKIFDLGYTGIFGELGLPITQCPMGLNSKDLPIGIQVVSGMNQDRLTIAVARELEKRFGGWKPPPTHGTYTLKGAMFTKSADQTSSEQKKVIDKW